MQHVHKSSISTALAVGLAVATFIGEAPGADASIVEPQPFPASQNHTSNLLRVQYGPGTDTSLTDAFVREKCDALADKAGLPKDLQDIRLIYPGGWPFTFAEFLCGAFVGGIPLTFDAHVQDAEDGDVVRVQIRGIYNMDFRQGRLLADGQTFVGASSPITGGTPALAFSKMTNTQTGEVDQDSDNLVILRQGWEAQMNAYLKQQK